ncbi:MAG: hypothetical protein ACPH5K_03965, partial [Polaribacter sp.]
MGKIDRRQGITRNPEVTVLQRLRSASRYVGSRFGEQTRTEKQLVNQFKDSYKAAMDKSNNFLSSEWNDYITKMNGISIAPFKNAEIIK